MRQWNRSYELIVGIGDRAVVITDLEIQFEVTKSQRGVIPNQLVLDVYNMNADHRARVTSVPKEQRFIQLSVGYGGVNTLLYRGQSNNVINVREQLERTVPRFEPDLVIYLVNKNDFNEPVHFTPLSYSHVLLHLRFLWHFTVGKKIRLMQRDGADRLAMFGREVDRMTRFLAERGTPFVVGFLRWSNSRAVWEADYGEPPFWRQLVNVHAVVDGKPRVDGHYARAAHRRMAAFFCEVIAEAEDAGCEPPGFRRDAVAARPGPAPGS